MTLTFNQIILLMVGIWLVFGVVLIIAAVRSKKPLPPPMMFVPDPVKKARPTEAFISGDIRQAFKLSVIGEGEHQDNINTLATRNEGRDFMAYLTVEPDNSVSVIVSSLKVGHLQKTKAAQFIKFLNDSEDYTSQVSAPLRIIGGHKLPSGAVGKYGVKIDMRWPPVIDEGRQRPIKF